MSLRTPWRRRMNLGSAVTAIATHCDPISGGVASPCVTVKQLRVDRRVCALMPMCGSVLLLVMLKGPCGMALLPGRPVEGAPTAVLGQPVKGSGPKRPQATKTARAR